MTLERSAGAVIFRKGENGIEYLLLKYEAGHWDFVKGNIEEGEDEKETVIREVEEETGINDLKFVDGFRETINYFYKRAKRTVYKEVIFYMAETKTKDVKISYEHIGYTWLDYTHAHRKLTFKNAKDTLQKANEFYLKQMS
ncbi:MAG: bis(5'-nucleosyl)-tetraphosphatase [Fidelibacterota bacterium]